MIKVLNWLLDTGEGKILMYFTAFVLSLILFWYSVKVLNTVLIIGFGIATLLNLIKTLIEIVRLTTIKLRGFWKTTKPKNA